jgi:hypothetical protein
MTSRASRQLLSALEPIPGLILSTAARAGVLGLGAFIVLFGPVSCLSDEGPQAFTTAGSCYPGDLQDCTCKTSSGVVVSHVESGLRKIANPPMPMISSTMPNRR